MATDVKNDANLSTGLVSYWELEEASGTRVDSHGSYDLTDNNTVGQDTGIQGSAADFVRANSETLTATVGASDFNTNGVARSMSLWFKPNDLSNGQVVAQVWGNTGARNFTLNQGGADPTKIRIYVRGVGTPVYSGTLTAGTWYHVVWTVDASGVIELFINGSSVGTGTVGSDASNGTALVFGDNPGQNQYLDAQVDEIGWWTKELSATEISDLYNSGAGIPYDAGGGGGVVTPQFIGFGGI